MLVKYESNNSGGNWWLEDKDWFALEAAGWTVHWLALDEFYTSGKYARLDEDGRWLGCLAKSASKEFPTKEHAIDEWESITGQDSTEEGCSCCGEPHYFSIEG